MKSLGGFLLFKMLVLVAGVQGASAIPAQAQAATRGTFTLTQETNWGGAVLPPGDYAFSLASQNWPAQLVVRKASGPKVAIVLPRLVSEEKLTGVSRLVLQHQPDGERFVSALHLGDLGVALYYAPPKAVVAAAETAKLGAPPAPQPGK
jgi:hypothetical protein